MHIGFQRRFDTGYRRVRDAVAAGELGFIHTVRAATMDQAPPHAAYLPTSGGLFRDCSVHDFDILRFVTGHEVSRVFAVGANKGEPFFTEAGDVDTAAATLVMDDGTLVSVTATRYNGAGHDVRMEVHGSEGTLGVGHDTTLAITSAEPGIEWPPGPGTGRSWSASCPPTSPSSPPSSTWRAVTSPSPCTVADALEAFRTAEACARSMTTGSPVDLAEHPDRSRRTVGSRLIQPNDPRIPSPTPIWDTDPSLRTTGPITVSSTPTRITHLINGLPWEGTAERTSPVFNPATGVQSGELDLASADLVDEVVTAAHEAWASRLGQHLAGQAHPGALHVPRAAQRAQGGHRRAHHRRARQGPLRRPRRGHPWPRGRRVRLRHPAPHEGRLHRERLDQGRRLLDPPEPGRRGRHQPVQLPRDGAAVVRAGRHRLWQRGRHQAQREGPVGRQRRRRAVEGGRAARRHPQRRAR